MNEMWPDRSDWEASKSGKDCPMCGPVPDVDRYGFTVAQLEQSVLRLGRNQFTDGYCALICSEHGPEPYSLPPERSIAYLRDMVRCGAALEEVFGPDKMNFLTLGNAVPHLHTHLIPRYLGDPAPGTPLLSEQVPEVTLSEAEYRDRVDRIRHALTA